MLVIPAIDLKGGRCVRLRQGRMDQESIYSSDPQAQAAQWCAAGAEWIHIVDLDGAVSGRSINVDAVAGIRAKSTASLQLGGGIRDMQAIEGWLLSGIERVILGTLACEGPSLVQEACTRFPGRIGVGIDVRDGLVMKRGWLERTSRLAIELAHEMEAAGAAIIVITDISRDGMQSGINCEGAREVAQALTIPVIVSGGAATMDDIRAAKQLEPFGIAGLIVGRALYEGTIDLAEAIALAGQGEGRSTGI